MPPPTTTTVDEIDGGVTVSVLAVDRKLVMVTPCVVTANGTQ